ncbi:apolipoprotein N-acyltransferase [Nioella aestuarii]|uniref:apolipoprotein N-acyltransferase n=1 Tax=Nioella aestuarii TaxID=1662864 RepID=UPI003D7FAB44
MTGAALWVTSRTLRQRLCLSFGAGVIAALGLAPFDLPLLALAGFAGFALLLIDPDGLKRAFWIGLAGGTGYFALSLHWIVEPFFVDPWRHGWMAPFALILMAAGLALFWGVAASLAVRLTQPGLLRPLIWALALVLVEMLRASIFTGFPWAHPGHIWIGSPLMGLAAWIGPHGLTALTLLLAAGIAGAVWSRPVIGAVPVAVLGAVFGAASLIQPAPAADENAPVIRLIQPNAPQHLKWLPEMIPVFFRRSLELTASEPQLADPPQLVIWPETSLPALLRNSEPWREAIGQAAGVARVVVGGQRVQDGTVRNSLFLLDQDGAFVATYDKHHLVPFGEYIPLTAMARSIGLRGLAEAAGPGYAPGQGPELLDLGELGRAFPMICYETIFPSYIRQVERPDWLLQITNDAWFGEFSGPFQHLELAQLRAVEQGLPLLRAANTGVSAVIDARGQVLSSLPLGEEGALDLRLPPPLPATVYARTGDWPIWVLLLGLSLCVTLADRRVRH